MEKGAVQTSMLSGGQDNGGQARNHAYYNCYLSAMSDMSNNMTHTCRVKLFNRGDKISSEAKERKLKREYIALIKLEQLIFWTDVGREGADHVRQQMRNKCMAEHMAMMDPDMSIKNAQKIIRDSLDVQRKADQTKRQRFSRSAPNNK